MDIANLIGSGFFTQKEAERWRRILFSQIGYGETDIVQVATGPGTKLEVAFAFRPIHVETASGPNGADFKLSDHLCDTAYLVSSYAEIVIASGDGHFVAWARKLTEAGLRVTVVTGIGKLNGGFDDLPIRYVDLKEGWEIVS